MQQCHPETFADTISDIGTAWVEKSKHAPSDKFTQIGNTEIWINAGGSAGKIRDMANRVLNQFKYPGELFIKKRKCAPNMPPSPPSPAPPAPPMDY